jgi:hypothetical protein
MKDFERKLLLSKVGVSSVTAFFIQLSLSLRRSKRVVLSQRDLAVFVVLFVLLRVEKREGTMANRRMQGWVGRRVWRCSGDRHVEQGKHTGRTENQREKKEKRERRER